MDHIPKQKSRYVQNGHSPYEIIAWQSEQSAWTADLAERQRVLPLLFRSLSPAIRVEPELLRHVRTLLSDAADASLESDFWMDDRLSSNHPIAATMRKDHSVRLRTEFANSAGLVTQQRVLDAIRQWHSALKDAPEIWLEEFLSLPPGLRKLIPESDEKDARACFVQLLRDLTEANSQLQEEASTYLTRATSAMRLSEFAYRDSEVGKLLDDTRLLLHPEARPKDWSDIRRIPTDRLRLFGIDISNDDSVCIRETQNILPSKSPGATFIRSQVEYLKLSDRPTDGSTSFWKTARPDFVSDFGTDQYGAWCEVRIPALSGRGDGEFVPHRFRWIPAGTFLMGSPDDEPERSSDEGPQHEVTLSRGFWMAETACPQGVWKAVTGENPSRFQGEERPVENVSWYDVQSFLQRINEAVPGLGLQLPTEAQWEYACRAGTTSPFHTGSTITVEQANYDGNYPYTGGAKGIYRRETVDVRTFPPNAWGLYEMHGNLWEWCADWYDRSYYSHSLSVDPDGPKRSQYRVVRGGSWADNARNVRSAYRHGLDPGDHFSSLGFRLLSSAMAEPSEGATVPVAEQGSQRTERGAAERVFRVPADSQNEPVRESVSFRSRCFVSSNLEEICFDRVPKPAWAVDFGRDRYGAFAAFEVPARQRAGTVRQTLRWIPPGQFVMGSPADEPGRDNDETQRSVTISRGFWMFDTPCTQKLWEAVMEQNPSHSPDPLRPVETVRWSDAVAFAERLSETVEGISFSLPTEAQWEYACRAGTTTAIFSGELDIRGDNNAPALDPIAWYGGNSGVDYDHEKFERASGWPNKQYDFDKAGTRRVHLKAPNPWGLYDMLGNVWEWCVDWYAEYDAQPQLDPQGPKDGALRVVRGGGWSFYARDVRSAYRYAFAPGDRYSGLGFRLLSSAGPVP